MDFKIINHTYENTGGGCMVSFDTVWLPEEDRTIFVHTNEMGCSFFTVDTYHSELYDVEPFHSIDTTMSYAELPKYFDVARECMRRYLRDDGINGLPYSWLPTKVQEQITADYIHWLNERYDDPDPFYQTDGEKLYLDDEYAEILSEQRRKLAAEEAAAVCAFTDMIDAASAFINFKNAYFDLVEKWERHQDIIDEILLDGQYPFDVSFDELPVPEWCDDVVRNLFKEGAKRYARN